MKKDLQELKKIFTSNILKVASKLNKKIQDITRDEYRKVVKDLELPKEEGKLTGGYKNMVIEVCTSDDAKKSEYYTDYTKLFEESLLSVSSILDKKIVDITRDEYVSVAKDNNIKALTKNKLQELGGYLNLKNSVFKEEIDNNVNRNYILATFKEYVVENNEVPTFKDFRKICSTVKTTFNTIEEIEEEARKEFPEIANVLFNETSFTPEYRKSLEQEAKNYNRFIITTAVSGKSAHQEFLNSLKNYSKRTNAMVLVLPCQDVASRKKRYEWNMAPELKDFWIVYKDLYLNDNIFISDIKVSAKQIVPTTGLSRFVQQNGSIVMASPKQFLEFIPSMDGGIPRAIMTTGSITISDYSTDKCMSLRTSKIAEYDHICGAIVVEIQDNKIFHFRQLQYTENKSIIDLGIEYFSNGSIKEAKDITVVLGDSHVGSHDLDVHKEICSILSGLDVKNIIVHDLFDGKSINHHDWDRPLNKVIKKLKNESSLEQEGKNIKKYLEDLASYVKNEIVIVASNHNEFLDRYLVECKFADDYENFYYSLDLCKALLEGKNVLKYFIMDKVGVKEGIKVKWLERNGTPYNIYGSELSNHGDKGANGSRGSLNSMEKCFGNAVIAHSHSPAIYRGVYRVGTSTKLRLDYNKGPSSWLHSVCIIYNGSRQLVNIIENKKGKYVWKSNKGEI